jgi:hypothetical protein
MITSRHTGEANVPAIILSSAVLILVLAAAYYLVAIVPTLNSDTTIDVDASSSASSSMMTSSVATGGTASSSASHAMTAEEQAAYDACINAATEAHNARWADACEDKKNTQESLYLACTQKNDQAYCDAQFGGYEDIGANCDLGTARTNTLNAQYAAAKQACAK